MQLNELGADGWELVQRMDGFFFLKKKLNKFSFIRKSPMKKRDVD